MSYYQLLEAIKKIAEDKEPWEKVKMSVYFEDEKDNLYDISFLELGSDGDIILS